MKAPFVRSPYNYDTNKAGDESGLDCSIKKDEWGKDLKPTEHGRTQQHFAEECDINTIVKRFGLGYDMPAAGIRVPLNGDFSNVVDLHQAMNLVRQAQESFDQLPADLRYNFDNNPAKLADFVSREENRELAGKMGLLNKDALEALKKAAADKKAAERQAIRDELEKEQKAKSAQQE